MTYNSKYTRYTGELAQDRTKIATDENKFKEVLHESIVHPKVRCPDVTKAKKIVLKFGTNSLTYNNLIDQYAIRKIAREVAFLHSEGKKVAIVTSGAVVMGMAKNSIKKRPKNRSELQDLAAEGQYSLMELYNHAFKAHNSGAWQILLTHHNFQTYKERMNIVERVNHAFSKNKVPIFNTNDPVTNEELLPAGLHSFSDNDPLAALVAKYIRADALVIFSDPGEYGSGGKNSKEKAIQIAESAGVNVLVTSINEIYSVLGKNKKKFET